MLARRGEVVSQANPKTVFNCNGSSDVPSLGSTGPEGNPHPSFLTLSHAILLDN